MPNKFRSNIDLSILCLIFICLFSPKYASAAGWSASIDERTGLPILINSGMMALSPSWNFWGEKWYWSEHKTTFRTISPYNYSIQGENKLLNIVMQATAQKDGHSQLKWIFKFDATTEKRNVTGGGIIFKFDLANYRIEMGDPVLLSDKHGWSWGREGGKRVEFRFEPALPAIYFEQGNKAEVRAFFYQGNIIPGHQHYTATLSVSNDISIMPTISERFGNSDPATWPQDVLDNRSASIDLSFLNNSDKPAGYRGQVKLKDDKLLFADGSPARFWGTNVTAYALFNMPRDSVKLQAKRLSALGFNLVRIHHHDSPWVTPNVFGNGKFSQGTLNLDQNSLDKLDWWIKCLKDEGIYVWLDMHVQRAFKAEDNIYGFDEIRKGKDSADLKGFNYVNPTIQQAMRQFNAAYLNHKNPYTGVANKDEPAIIAYLLTNENDVTSHFGNFLLPDKKNPDHSKIYMSEAEGFARSHNLPKDKVWRSWEHGPSKLFLNDMERRFNVDAIDHVRRLGAKAPIVTTNTWGYNPLSSLPALTSGDLIDVHSYGGYGQLEKSPMYGPTLTQWMAAGQVVGKPLTVTEWNAEPFPLPDRHTLPLYVAASAAHQGWDALMHYAYTQEPTDRNSPNNWHAYNDPSLIAMFPAAALLYRQGHAKEATTTYVFDPGQEVFFNQAISPANSVALRTAAEKGKLLIAMPQTKELPWLERKPIPAGATILRDPNQSVLPANASEATTDTGELKRNWDKGTYSINTPRTQAAMGWIGGETINFPNVEIKLTTRNASVAVQSLDDKPLGKSRDILISMATRSVPKSGNKAPFLVEPIEGQLKIQAPQGLKVYRKGQLLKETEVPATYGNGSYTIRLNGKQAENWLILRTPTQ